eukprot:SAG22_NODE_5030_length_1103_cov_1.550797_2_plen_294_part_00
MLKLTMPPDTICTATTLLANGTKGSHPTPPASARMPKTHFDDFTAGYTADTLARGFSDVYGSFAVRPTTNPKAIGGPGAADSEGGGLQQMALTQVSTAKPTGWAPTNLDPLTLFGDSMWHALTVNVTAIINHTSASPLPPQERRLPQAQRGTDPPPPPIQPPYVKVCGGCGDTSVRGLSYGCTEGCCFRLSHLGNWTLGSLGRAAAAGGQGVSGKIPGFTDTYHKIGLEIAADGTLSASVDGARLGSVGASCPKDGDGKQPGAIVGFPGHGMVGLGCGAYHTCQFDSFAVEAE